MTSSDGSRRASTVTETPFPRQSSNEDQKQALPRVLGGTKDFGFLPIPKSLRYDSDTPFRFTTVMNITFGVASTFTVANLYYCQPLLIQFADSFGVTDGEVARIPTLVQAGYATGLLFISPLGDLVRRRALLLLLVFISASLTIGLSITRSLLVFEVICFLVGVFTVTPQVLIPLAADLAPPEKRASAISIVLSGLLLGILVARVFAGIIAQFVSWRVVYILALGLQYLIMLMLYLVLPDWPAKNKGVTYLGILGSMAKLAVTEPILIQACLISVASSATFTSFWVTLTFLLSGAPYHYTTLEIGLFGLIGMFGVMMAPITGRVVDRLVPWVATLVATLLLLVFQSVQTIGGGINIAAVIIACFGLDLGRQMQQVSLVSSVYGISPDARARLNAVLILCIFLGQVMGTSVGSEVFVRFGWRACGALSLGWMGWQLFILMIRGPHCDRKTWIGWQGGWEPRKSVMEERLRKPLQAEEAAAGLDEKDPNLGKGGEQEHSGSEIRKDATGSGVENV